MKDQKQLKTVQGEWLGETQDSSDSQEIVVVKEFSCSFD